MKTIVVPQKTAVDGWLLAASLAVPCVLVILGLMAYWFMIADRWAIFLYYHLGAGPFDEMTQGRYWMAGLVAAGLAMIFYGILNWYMARFAALRNGRYRPPGWWQVWLIALLPLTAGIALITSWGTPPLPLNLTLLTLGVTLTGFAAALYPGTLAARDMRELVWLLLASAGLLPALLLLRVIELPAEGMATPLIAWTVAISTTIVGLAWVCGVTVFHARQTRQRWTAAQLFVCGCCLSYLLLPVIHHLFFTPAAYRYISTSANFFALRLPVQVLCFAAAGLSALAAVQLQRRLVADN